MTADKLARWRAERDQWQAECERSTGWRRDWLEAMVRDADERIREGEQVMTWHPGIPETYRNQIATGDARLLAAQIPDESVDLIFTDPVYERIEDYRWLAETAARVLKPNSAVLVFCSIGQLPETINALAQGGLSFRWQLIEYRTNEVKHRHAPGGKCLYVPLMWFDKGKYRPSFVLDVRAIPVYTSTSNHFWSKPPITISYYLSAFTVPSAIVYDPFTGGGTVPAVCKMLGRNFIASEIDPAIADRARERLANTQPPLPGLVVEQIAFDLEVA